MYFSTAQFLLMVLIACLLQSSPAKGENELYKDEDENDGKERLQIEGTELRNVEEGRETPAYRSQQGGDSNRGNNFNSYWARLNWGRPSGRVGSSWTEDSRRERVQYRRVLAPSYVASSSGQEPKRTWEDAQQKRSRNGEERAARVETAAASSAVVAYDPEVELIESSRISADLANLRFMRMEKPRKEEDAGNAAY